MKKAHSVAGTWSIQKNESRNVRPIWGVINAENVPSISSGNNFTRIKKGKRKVQHTRTHNSIYKILNMFPACFISFGKQVGAEICLNKSHSKSHSPPNYTLVLISKNKRISYLGTIPFLFFFKKLIPSITHVTSKLL